MRTKQIQQTGPNISSNTLFHFTGNADNLLGILTNEFRPKFCLEDLRSLSKKRYSWLEIAIPMTCFCDLPIYQTRTHLETYGGYGIGLTKEWGQKKGISPVMYFYPDSSLTKHLDKLLFEIADKIPEKKRNSVVNEAFKTLFTFLKPYDGKLWRGSGYLKKRIRFYNEREWRYVPRQAPLLLKDDFTNSVSRAHSDSRLRHSRVLSFHPDDIKYLIVAREREILPLVHSVRQIKSKYSQDSIDLLCSRIVSSEQILEDF